MNDTIPYLIIGAGAAGIAAAETIRAAQPGAEIEIICREPVGYYSRPGLAYYLSGEIPESQLFPFTLEEFAQRRLTLEFGEVAEIQPAAHTVTLQNGVRLKYDRLLIATGAEAMRAAFEGADLPGVVYLDSLAEVRGILALARRGKRAVVVGGGITALELAEGLHARGVQTHYLLRKDRYWANVLDENESKIVENRLIHAGITLHYHTEIETAVGKRSGLLGRGPAVLAGVKTTGSETIPCDILGVAIGVRPRLDLAKRAGLQTDRAILVSPFMETSAPDIYAAGDAAQVVDPHTGKEGVDILWPVAVRQGRIAGMNMAGVRTPYEKQSPLNVTRLAGLTTTIIGMVGSGKRDEDTVGIVRGDSETWRKMPDAIAAQSHFETNQVRLMVGERAILGAVVMGDQSVSKIIQVLAEGKVDITPIRSQLLSPQARITDILVDFWVQRSKEA